MEIKAETINDAWIQSLRLILNQEELVKHKENLLKEINNLTLEIANPSEKRGLTTVEWDSIKTLNPPYDIRYIPEHYFMEYDRIFEYHGTNQLERVITKLKTNPTTRNATITLPEPTLDTDKTSCLLGVNYNLRKGKLDVTAIYRSHDYGVKLVPNLNFQSDLMKQVCENTGTNPGKLICHSISAHVYYDR